MDFYRDTDTSGQPYRPYRCEGCNEFLREEDVEPYGKDSLCHVVPRQVGEHDWEPEPCGPVIALRGEGE